MQVNINKSTHHLKHEASVNDISKDDWTNIFNSMADMVTIHDRDFNIIFANTEAIKQLNLPSIASSKVKCFKYYHGTECPPEKCPSCRCLKTGITSTSEIYEPYLKKYIEIRALPRHDSARDIIGIIHIVRDITKRKQQEKKMRESRQKLRNLTAHLISIREQEREHIAREIHDELAQSLTALKMKFVLLSKKLPVKRHVIEETMRPISNIIDNTIGSVQRVCAELRPQVLDELGLEEAIKWQVRQFQGHTAIPCKVKGSLAGVLLTPQYNTNLFRILQETLTNISRHAKATKVLLSLSAHADTLQMEVRDNGCGIAKAAINSPKSIGIIGIRERVLLMKGNLDIKRAEDKGGTTVSVRIPLRKRGAKNSIKQSKRES